MLPELNGVAILRRQAQASDKGLREQLRAVERARNQAGQAYRSPNARAFEIFDFSTFYTRACRVPHTHQRGPQLTP